MSHEWVKLLAPAVLSPLLLFLLGQLVVTQLRDDLDDMGGTLGEVQVQVVALQDEFTELHGELTALDEDFDDLRSVIIDIRERVSKIEGVIEAQPWQRYPQATSWENRSGVIDGF